MTDAEQVEVYKKKLAEKDKELLLAKKDVATLKMTALQQEVKITKINREDLLFQQFFGCTKLDFVDKSVEDSKNF
jgi:hypothetical protein